MTRPETLIVIDVGNTNTVVGCYSGDELVTHFRLSTDAERTADEYTSLIAPLFTAHDIDPRHAESVVVSSVVPPLRQTIEELAAKYFGHEAVFVEPGIRTEMSLRVEKPEEVGADRIVNAVAARARYGTPIVIVDFGTATTFDVVGEQGDYLGGIIAPGVSISAEALFAQASRLYRVDLLEPTELVGRSTAGAMQSGIFYGYVSLVDGILERLAAETEISKVVATGGLAELIARGSRYIEEVSPLLTLHGLKVIHELNRS